MGYRVLTTLILATHFAFIGFVVLGGFLAWRWHWVIVPHVVAAIWGFLVVTVPLNCPLTWAENWSRVRSGEPAATTSFIDRYLTGVFYPARYVHQVPVLVGVVVVVSWVGVFLRWRAARS